MLLNILPSTFPLSRDVGHEHNAFHHDHRGADVSSHDNILQDIEEEFGLGTSDPFKKIQEEMKSSILNDPFDIAIGASFDSTDNAYCFDEDTQNDALFDGWYDHMDSCDLGDEDGDAVWPARKKRSPNLFPYKFGDVFQANWYSKFLAPDVREKTYALSSRDRYGHFRCLFRMPLHKIDDLVDMFLEKMFRPSFDAIDVPSTHLCVIGGACDPRHGWLSALLFDLSNTEGVKYDPSKFC